LPYQRSLIKSYPAGNWPYCDHVSRSSAQRANEGAEDSYSHVRGETPGTYWPTGTLAQRHRSAALYWWGG